MDIKRRVIAGAKYSDFAIIARGAAKYEGILDAALNKAAIPAFASYSRDITEFEAIKLIYTAYSAIRGFERDFVMTYAKCALSGVSREECDEFEMYVNKWQINGKRFTEDGVWSMNPLGYTTKRGADTDEKLQRIHGIRTKIISPLVEFARGAESAHTVEEHAHVLLDFLLKLDIEEGLEARAETLLRLGETAFAEQNRKLWKIICDALDTVVEVLGDAPASAEDFLLQLKVVFSSFEISRIPAFADEVTVGSADMLRLFDKPHVYMIGVNAGEFPATVGDDSYFSEHEKRLLSDLGLGIRGDSELKSARELYIFSRAFSYADETVTISYSSCDTKFKAINKSDVIDKICSVTQSKVIKITDIPIIDKLYSAEMAIEGMGGFGEYAETVSDALSASGYEREVDISRRDITNASLRLGEDILSDMRGKVLNLSQTKIDTYVKCPFSSFCKDTLSLKSDERAEFDAANIGVFIHAILENFFSDISNGQKQTAALSDEEKREIARRAAERYISSLGEDLVSASSTTKTKIERLCRAAMPVIEGLCDEFSVSRFSPRFFELSLGREKTPDLITLTSTEGTTIQIRGTVDRVDSYERDEDIFLRVVDYKTGKKDFSDTDMKEGKNLQMFLYLKAIIESKNENFINEVGRGKRSFIPAGVIYVKTDVDDLSIDLPDDSIAADEIKKRQVRQGMVIDDADVIDAMVLRYTPLYSARSPKSIPKSKRNLIYDMNGWGDIMKTVEDSVIGVADRMLAGEIYAIPQKEKKHSPCTYCEFKPICRKVEL